MHELGKQHAVMVGGPVSCDGSSWNQQKTQTLLVSTVMGVPKNGWFIRVNPSKTDDNWGYPYDSANHMGQSQFVVQCLVCLRCSLHLWVNHFEQQRQSSVYETAGTG